MVFHRLKWVPAVLGVALALGILPSSAKGDNGDIDSGTAVNVGDGNRADIKICGTIPLDGHNIGDGDLCTFMFIHVLLHPTLGELVCTTPSVNSDGSCRTPFPYYIDKILGKDDPQHNKKSFCTGDNNDVNCKDERQQKPKLSKMKVDQKQDAFEYCLVIDDAAIPHSKDDIFGVFHLPVSLRTTFQFDCSAGRGDIFSLDAEAPWCDTGGTNIRTPLSKNCK